MGQRHVLQGKTSLVLLFEGSSFPSPAQAAAQVQAEMLGDVGLDQLQALFTITMSAPWKMSRQPMPINTLANSIDPHVAAHGLAGVALRLWTTFSSAAMMVGWSS